MRKTVLAIAALGCATGAALGQSALVVHGGAAAGAPLGGELGSIDLQTGAYTSIGTPLPGVGLTGVTFVGNRLFASTANLSLIEINPNDGSLISETSFTGAGFGPNDRINDLTTAPDGAIYAFGRIGGTDSLLTVTQGGSLTNLGAIPSTGGFGAGAFDGQGRLWGDRAATPDGVVWELNPSDGSLIASLNGGPQTGLLGLGFDPVSGLLVGSECCGEGLGEAVYLIDPDSGATSLLINYGDGRRIQDFAVIPAPGAMGLVGLSLLAGVRRRR